MAAPAADDGPDMIGARTGMRFSPPPVWRSGRCLRAAVFTLLSSALAVVAHQLASEGWVSWQRASVGASLVFALSWLVVRRPRPWWQVVAATDAAQLLLHQGLSVPQAAPHAHPEAHDGLTETVHAAHHGAWEMAAAHCVAAWVMALLMYHADQALSRLPETVNRWAHSAVAAAAAAFGLHRRPWVRPCLRTVPASLNGLALQPTVTAMLCHALVRRGPPAGCAGNVPPILAGSAPAR